MGQGLAAVDCDGLRLLRSLKTRKVVDNKVFDLFCWRDRNFQARRQVKVFDQRRHQSDYLIQTVVLETVP